MELLSSRKNVEDFTGPRERSDLGFITFDITADILQENVSLLSVSCHIEMVGVLQNQLNLGKSCTCIFISKIINTSSLTL